MAGKTVQRLDYKKTILIGFGFMATSIAWGIYDPYVTKILNDMLSASDLITNWSTFLAQKVPFILELMKAQGEDVNTAGGGFTLVPFFIGIIMTFDNIFGVIFQPTFGKLSDRCRSKYGKRRPFIFIGAPVSAVLFFLIPFMSSITALMTCIILFVFVMSLWRSPVVALMPDLTPPKLRSEGNAVINLCGGVGGLVGMMAGTVFIALLGFAKDGKQEFPYVFGLGALVMIIGTLILRFFVPEQDSRTALQTYSAQEELSAREAEKKRLKDIKLSGAERRSLVFMLLCLFFLFCGSNAIQTFFALFAGEVLGKGTSEATMMMAVFAVCAMLAAIPAGKLGKKIGRKKTILIGLLSFMSVFLLYVLFSTNSVLVWVALVVGGAANMLITVNTLPLVLEIGGLDKVGTFTGYYYTATFSAQIAAPITYGIVRVFSDSYLSLFYYCPAMFCIAILCLLAVRHGEAKIDQDQLEQIVEQVELENAD